MHLLIVQLLKPLKPFVRAGRAVRCSHALAALCALAWVALATSGCAAIKYRGPVAVDARVYPQPPQHPGQTWANGLSGRAEPDFSIGSDNGEHVGVLRPFLRFDPQDSFRTHFDLRQADYTFFKWGMEAGAGIGLFRWGVLESARLNDVINQIDLVEDIGMRAKLGQPYTRLKYTHWLDILEGELAIEALYLPVQRPRPFPGTAGRLRPYGGVDLKALVESPAGLLHPSFAARGSYVGDHLEVALTGFSGLSREPRFLAQLTHPSVAPAYDLLQQVGLDGALAFESLVLKAEGAARLHGLKLRPSWALAVGAEYTFAELLFDWDLTLIGEYVHDRRPPNTAFTILQNDLVGGFRVGFNDTKGTELLGSTSVDMDTFATTLMLRGARRLDDHWKVAGEARVFVVGDHAPEWWLQRDSYLQASLEYWF